jgi:hypothetical protein
MTSPKDQRLGSLFHPIDQQPRDKTLGGAQKTKFTPTIPAARRAKAPAIEPKEQEQPKQEKLAEQKPLIPSNQKQQQARIYPQHQQQAASGIFASGPVGGAGGGKKSTFASTNPFGQPSLKASTSLSTCNGGYIKRSVIHDDDDDDEEADSGCKEAADSIKFIDNSFSLPQSSLSKEPLLEEGELFLLQVQSLPAPLDKAASLQGQCAIMRIRQSGKKELAFIGDGKEIVFELANVCIEETGGMASFPQHLYALEGLEAAEKAKLLALGEVRQKFVGHPTEKKTE